MAPPGPLNLDVEAISGICGSISIACWVFVFSPQIIENFRRSSAEGLSIQFIVVWLLGDVFNILGAVLQGVLPTMIILAIYYTIADVVLLAQCFYYRGFTLRDDVTPPPATPPPKNPKRNGNGSGAGDLGEPNERTGLLASDNAAAPARTERSTYYHSAQDRERRGSWTHLSPAVPLVSEEPVVAAVPLRPTTRLQACAFNTLAILMVSAAGVAGWWLSRTDGQHPGEGDDGRNDPLEFNLLGQIFGWLCAALYLGSRVPQLLLNWRRKSTEGVSVLFFLFACLGNLTYVLSILAFDPQCDGDEGCEPGEAAQIFWQYILVNLSWLAGSAGTLLLDLSIFVQFFLYNKTEEDESSEDESTDEESIGGDTWDQRPVLERNNTGY
ncbi:putative vacuolar amino acid transporter YPQ3 [Achaetomium macrosporum]|uniref:Vacuolar amino acid transporter YPQ3 n=1 Tax=Achaetomium macrosporum TaxID=79813 RepID=A0AAN7CE40_9PEZI|nr:putative vacuolar amino acid transporter YPQ3 [Achaetomium macrosporum]